MKLIIALAVALLSSGSAFADCSEKAVRAAREQSRQAVFLDSIIELEVAKSYLESYQVTLVDSEQPPREIVTFDIILMKSSCSIVSMIRHLD